MDQTAQATDARELVRRNKPFVQHQSHWFRVVDGLVVEHWATRDDLGFLHQVGVAPYNRVGAEGPP